MADQPDYTTANPAIMLGDLGPEGQLPEHRIPLKMFNKDGSPCLYREPTPEEAGKFVDEFLKIADGIDARIVLYHLIGLHGLIANAVRGGVSLAHMQAITTPEDHDDLDPQTLVHGITQYLTPPPEEGEINSDNVGEHVLKNFFPDKDDKPH